MTAPPASLRATQLAEARRDHRPTAASNPAHMRTESELLPAASRAVRRYCTNSVFFPLPARVSESLPFSDSSSYTADVTKGSEWDLRSGVDKRGHGKAPGGRLYPDLTNPTPGPDEVCAQPSAAS
jgi:hypothetical protein